MVQNYTFTYHRVCGIDIKLDIYLPEPPSMGGDAPTEIQQKLPIIPSVVFFHGGGLTSGSREVYPKSFKADTLSSKLAFITADFRLLFPFSARHIHEDVLALFKYLSTTVNQDLLSQSSTSPPGYLISEKLFAVAGVCSGGYAAQLAVLYATPRPCAFFSLYGIGGDLLSPLYIRQAPISGWESNLGESKMFIAPSPEEKASLLPGLSSCPRVKPPDVFIPGYEERLSPLIFKLLKSGTYLDHMMDYPGLVKRLLQAANKDSTPDPTSPIMNYPLTQIGSSGANPSSNGTQKLRRRMMETAIPEEIRYLFPQLHITKSFPPTYLVHGTNDVQVDCRESKEMAKRLYEVGVVCDLVLAGGLGHDFDSPEISGAMGQVLWNRFLGEVVPFLVKHLTAASLESEGDCS